MSTLGELVAAGRDEDAAIAAPDRQAFTFNELRAQVDYTIARLNELGVGRNDAVAIVLPNGPEMASAFICIGAAATTAPLNPAYRGEEFDFYLEDLQPKLLVVEDGTDSPAVASASRLGINVVTLQHGTSDPAGKFELIGEPIANEALLPGPAQSNDIALVLHTSGTTSRPKLVPLSQQNVCASARNVAQSLALTPGDRCLNIMPLFHIHGLIAAVLGSMHAGASVSCTPGFNALKFFNWLEDVRPSWYTGVPTMHQAILSRAGRNREIIESVQLRLLRSSSASLPPQVMQELEETFDAPVIEAYGMTEAAHQMACNPLPRGSQKPGAVGLAAGPEVSIMNQAGEHLAAGEIGEIVIRGENVTSGYLNNDEANASAFTDGWFRTGDQGHIDTEGYLTLTGRLKEIINRGGEKISPREVDEILLDHQSVAQVVTFAMPHPKLGEEVAAAIVLEPGSELDESGLRDYAATRLADFKVPKKVVFLEEIPKGPTGKLQRIGLAEKLGLA
ncbi:MAG: acyl--CoA ligase [Gammaproteobacteria bacterium]|jgi:acyl-CoA synthetase (AMP-forming)/AMP-acid ligase II|nr:acyl--CoA ligase [Gammaproteobacteria bacterium]MDP6536140.1 acyl--CoA ligase [Gammaproteobacteria bacterium]MDP6732532.1 acyl--CoA ligase [Gammaproteobacteria bacterium]HAJ76981.1 AMP-dependent synthetase [Gammaproteobacteria bacterium]